MPKLQLTISPTLLVKVDAIAERDAPGAPNRSATGLRLLALGIAQEEALRPLDVPTRVPLPEPELPTSAQRKYASKGKVAG